MDIESLRKNHELRISDPIDIVGVANTDILGPPRFRSPATGSGQEVTTEVNADDNEAEHIVVGVVFSANAAGSVKFDDGTTAKTHTIFYGGNAGDSHPGFWQFGKAKKVRAVTTGAGTLSLQLLYYTKKYGNRKSIPHTPK